MENLLNKLSNVSDIGPTTLYYQIAKSIQKLIEKENIKTGTKLPSEQSLAEYFNVSRPTISNAIDLLIKKSLVYRNRGKGTFVKGKEIKVTLTGGPISFGEALKRAGINSSTEVLELKKIKTNKTIAKWLDLKTESTLVYLRRLRYIDKRPFLLIESYLPYDLFPDLTEIDFTKLSLYYVLNQKYNRPIIKVERNMRVARVSEDEIQFFKVPIGYPLLQMQGITYSNQDKRVEYFNTKMKADNIILSMTLYSDKV